MSIPAKYLIRTILAAGIAALLFASAGQAAGGKTQTLRFFDKVVFTKHTDADGKVVTREPQPGDVLDVIALEYAGNHAKHARKPSGTAHLRCTFVDPAGPPDCVSHVAFGGSMLVFEDFPGTLVLGTGKYLGATGRVISNTDVGNNNSDIVARVTLAG